MRLSKWNTGIWPNQWWLLRYALPYNGVFHIGARFHDIWYERWWDENDRQRIDEMFYRLMLSVSTNLLQRFFAKLYYKLVQKFGYKYFTYIIKSNTNN